ncbi:MAG TPA: L,D-transpeptidase [Amycolatopsis sp.]|uniref:L,D-transpeptidase n=1 Tax=Amycolatopsis sp. TaxID=37632 RepID=UPI002B4A1626|nr:L,D-transpeptidase [Amycolatopsis sp.]HKS47338.1 L,D-transpeptidase [Amycolatopsis sp.]
MKKILAVLGGIAAAAVLAACSSAAGSTTALPISEPPSTTVPSSSEVPATTTPPPATPSTPKTTTKTKTAPAGGTPCEITDGACVDLSAKKAWLLKDGQVSYGPVPIMPGKKGSTTPVGMFSVIGKEKMHHSHEFNNAPMPNSVFFAPGDAFHTGSLDNYSNGCVHLSSTASLKFFNTLQVGDKVQIVN